MSADEPLTPPFLETLAQSYAVLVLEGKRTLDEILPNPPQLRNRVEYLLHLEKGEEE